MDKIIVKKPMNTLNSCSGNRMYIIDGQDGSFPQIGEHINHEMSGIWTPPIKLLDGFWMKVDDEWLLSPEKFIKKPYGSNQMYKEKDIVIERFQFVPDEVRGCVIRFKFSNLKDTKKNINIEFAVATDLQGSWLSERNGTIRGNDIAILKNKKIIGKNEINPWYVMVESSIEGNYSIGTLVPEKVYGNGITFSIKSEISLEPDEEIDIYYFIAGSDRNKEMCDDILNDLKENHKKMLFEKINKYKNISEKAKLFVESDSNDSLVMETYEWTKYNTDWLYLKTDTDEGVTAGFPDFPWWFGNDITYIIPGMLMTGDYYRAIESLRTVKKYSLFKNNNGRVVHEISNNGIVFYEGMLNETSQFVECVLLVFKWTGNIEFLKEMYSFCKMGMEWLYKENCPHDDGLPEGYGSTEFSGLNLSCCDVAVNGIKGLESLYEIADILGYKKDAEHYKNLFELRIKQFEEVFWLEDEYKYGEMAAYPAEIIERAKNWKISISGFPLTDKDKINGFKSCKIDKSPKEENEKKIFYKTLDRVIEKAMKLDPNKKVAWRIFGLANSILPVSFGYCDIDRGKKIMDLNSKCIEKRVGESVMGVSIGREALAESKVENYNRAYEKIEFLASTFFTGSVGSTSEILPDSGCFLQGWNNFSSMWPFASIFFGIKPDVINKTIEIKNGMAKKIKKMKLLNVIIGGESFDFIYENQKIKVICPNNQWKIINNSII